MQVSRRRLLGLVGSGLAAQACAALPFARQAPPVTIEDGVDALAERVVHGGVEQDGIPPIESASYARADYGDRILGADDLVDGVVYSIQGDDTAVAYPRLITVWHEIVNERIGSLPFSITYCPLTGSSIVFLGMFPDGRGTSFGTSGRLLNSNLVMYDRETGNLWSQILGVALTGDFRGKRLRELPTLVTTTWARWKQRYPETRVLEAEQAGLGKVRPYGTSPYGDYDRNDRIIFPVEARDDRFHPKRVVVGLRLERAALAIPKEEFLRRDELVQRELDGEPLAIVPDAELGTIRVFKRRLEARTLNFVRRDGGFTDDETRTRWDLEGRAIEGPLEGERLSRVNAFDVQWFAWYAFYPRTAVLT